MHAVVLLQSKHSEEVKLFMFSFVVSQFDVIPCLTEAENCYNILIKSGTVFFFSFPPLRPGIRSYKMTQSVRETWDMKVEQRGHKKLLYIILSDLFHGGRKKAKVSYSSWLWNFMRLRPDGVILFWQTQIKIVLEIQRTWERWGVFATVKTLWIIEFSDVIILFYYVISLSWRELKVQMKKGDKHSIIFITGLA